MPKAERFETVPLKVLAEKGLTKAVERPRPLAMVAVEPGAANALAVLVAESGWGVVVANNTESALELAQVIPPELLIADVELPELGGIRLAVAIKKSIPDCNAIILFSPLELADAAAAEECVRQGFAMPWKTVDPSRMRSLLEEMRLAKAVGAP